VQLRIFLEGLKEQSLQGDAMSALIFPFLGVSSKYEEGGVRITKNHYKPKAFAFDFEECPDIVQTCAVVAAAKHIPLLMRGLNTLRVKETDRIHALVTELKKFGVQCSEPGKGILEIRTFDGPKENNPVVETYEDHRMAMAFAPLAIVHPGLRMEEPTVVAKSWPGFWEQLKKLGAKVE
jgi:3-phosphoshikimate 1-carboxyvinyltransferase